jgi:hypothetical protein
VSPYISTNNIDIHEFEWFHSISYYCVRARCVLNWKRCYVHNQHSAWSRECWPVEVSALIIFVLSPIFKYLCNVCFTDIVLCIHDCDFWTLLAQPVSLIVNGDGFKVSAYRVPSAFSLSMLYLLEYAQRIRHKLNKRMKSSPIYNTLQHYLIEHACLWIFLTLICVN